MDAKVESDDLNALFNKATAYVRTIAGNLSSEKLLYLYGRFKQANEGPCNVPKPGFFDFQGKQKWEAWNKLGQLSKEDAMTEYIGELSNIDVDWEEKAGVAKAKAGLGMGVSTLYKEDEHIEDCDKTLFDWIKENNTEKVASLLQIEKTEVNTKDAEGMTPLHWACDRGLEEMVQLLLRHEADINLTDEDGQSPLHVAAFCEHEAVIRCLLTHGADRRATDNEGSTAADVCENKQLKELLQPS